MTDFIEFKRLLLDHYPQATESMDGILAVPLDDLVLSIAKEPGDADSLIFRMRVLQLSELKRVGAFATAALAGNFFWSGTNGATLSVGPDDALFLTERRSLEEFNDIAELQACFEDYARAVNAWRIRGQLYA